MTLQLLLVGAIGLVVLAVLAVGLLAVVQLVLNAGEERPAPPP